MLDEATCSPERSTEKESFMRLKNFLRYVQTVLQRGKGIG